MDIYSIEHRTTDLGEITADLSWGTGTVMSRITIVTTRTRIHRGHKHERAWIINGIFCPTDRYPPVFKGLAKYFEGALGELCQLIKKENTVMGQRHLSRQGLGGTAREGYL